MPGELTNIPHITTALIDGKQMPYDVCASEPRGSKDSYHWKVFKYLGYGKCYSINGTLQSYRMHKPDTHFFERIKS